METSKIPARLQRAARDISRLPPELHEPILSQLHFADVVRLALSPSASSLLHESIRSSDEWRWLFHSHLTPIMVSWAALDDLCWLWCSRTWSALWLGRRLGPSRRRQTRDIMRGVFFYSSQELKDEYGSATRNWSRENYSDTVSEDALAEVMKQDLQTLVVSLFRVFMGSKGGMREYRVGAYFSLAFWRLHRGLGPAERRAVALFLPEVVRHAVIRGERIPGQWDQSETWQQRMEKAPTEDTITRCADALVSRVWTHEQVLVMLPVLRQALNMINLAQAAELDAMVDLYDRHPGILKEPRAPNSPRKNVDHSRHKLRDDANRARGRAAFVPRKTHADPNPHGAPGTVMVGNHRFRHAHLALIPYNWCLHLFDSVTRTNPLGNATQHSVYPAELHGKLRVALAGFEYTYGHGTTDDTDITRRPRISTSSRDGPYYLLHIDGIYGCPKPSTEIRWLEAFVECVDWMSQAFAEECAHARRACFSDEPAADVIRYKTRVMSAKDYDDLVKTTSPKDIARHLCLDADVCENKGGKYEGVLPSLLALHTPSFESRKGKEIALHLLQKQGTIASIDIGRLIYESLIDKITYHIQYPRLGEPTASVYRRWISKPPATESTGAPAQTAHSTPSSSDARVKNTDEQTLQDSLRIAERLKSASVNDEDIRTATAALGALQKLVDLQISQKAKAKVQSNSWDAIMQDYNDSLMSDMSMHHPQHQSRPIVRCYICRFTFTQPHPTFPSMCIPCGDFNLAGSAFTQSPSILTASAVQVAVVTGGRVNLGYHLALRLLLSGFSVIITTRYPRDALQRYEAFFKNKGREFSRHLRKLRIIGADFRTSVDVFATAKRVKQTLAQWDEYGWYGTSHSVYVLINNAAQTLTDSVEKEKMSIQQEGELAREQGYSRILLTEEDYTPRIRGGMMNELAEPDAPKSTVLIHAAGSAVQDQSSTIASYSGPSSWVQKLSDIPYTDFISAHSVNTFAPLILIRELVPIMGCGGAPGSLQGHIVNVSSREGIFEARRGNTAKRGRHVHTNMSKAGLNMITETEAETLWKEKRIAMNTVDPGYMSAAPECAGLFGGERPISWEDGAGRVLWPIYRMEEKFKEWQGKGKADGKGEREYEKYWGRFFKHYGAVRVEPRFGRG